MCLQWSRTAAAQGGTVNAIAGIAVFTGAEAAMATAGFRAAEFSILTAEEIGGTVQRLGIGLCGMKGDKAK
jgi:hypothetical protein